jgi:nucleoside-diphosphate-sugar epimerase
MTESTLHSLVLVTGAGGFIGRRVVARLLDSGHTVRALLLEQEPAPVAWADRVEVLRADVRDAPAMSRAVAGASTVLHLAALVGEATSDYAAHWEVTAEGSDNVYRAAAAGGARVVVTTSICAYGAAIHAGGCREDGPRGLHQGPYGRAKQAQEDFALAAESELGLAVTILRPANVYGVGSKPWVEMLGAALAAEAFSLIGDGSENAGLVHVENVVDALVLAGASEVANGRTYNVCDGLDVTWQRYAGDLAQMLGVAPPALVPWAPLHAAAHANEDPQALIPPKDAAVPALELLNLIGSNSRFPTERIRSELGWKPRIGYGEAMAEIERHLTRA